MLIFKASFLVIFGTALYIKFSIPCFEGDKIKFTIPNRSLNSSILFKETSSSIFLNSIGFAVLHKQEALDYFANEQRIHIEVQRNKKTSDVTHRYYWELTSRNRNKPSHPGENDEFIPKEIRGKHYDSWSAIAEDMGYGEDSLC